MKKLLLALTIVLIGCNSTAEKQKESKNDIDLTGTWIHTVRSNYKQYLVFEAQGDSYLITYYEEKGLVQPNPQKFISKLIDNTMKPDYGTLTYSPENKLIYFMGEEFTKSE